MAKCKITVLFVSKTTGELCFNPLVSIEKQATIAELQEKVLALYVRKSKRSISSKDVLSLTTMNAGIRASIVDDSDTVMDVLGREATITLLVEDAVNLMPQVPSLPQQLQTPISSTAPSLDLGRGIQQDVKPNESVSRASRRKLNREKRIAKRKLSLECTASPTTKKRKRVVLHNVRDTVDSKTAPISQEPTLTKQQLSAMDHIGSVRDQDSLLANSDDDGFQFVKTEAALSKSTDASSIASAHVSNSQDTIQRNIDREAHRDVPEQDRLSPEQSNSHEPSKIPLTESNLQLVPATMPRHEYKKDAISVASSSIHSSHIIQHIVQDSKQECPDSVPETQLQDMVGKQSPSSVVHKISNYSVDEPESHECRSQNTVKGTASPLREELYAQNHPNGTEVTERALDTQSESVSDVSDSELADYLSSATDESVHEPLTEDLPRSPVDLPGEETGTSISQTAQTDPASDDSSSMKSGDIEQDGSATEDNSDDEVGGHPDQDKDEDNIEHLANDDDNDDDDSQDHDDDDDKADIDDVVPERTTFASLSRVSPEPSQQTLPLPELGSDREHSSPEGSRIRPAPMRPGLKSSYKSLSFLHEAAMRERDDMTKLASPLKPSGSSEVMTTNHTGQMMESADEDDTDDSSSNSSSSSSSSEDESQSNLPSHKRAKLTSKKPKKRHSQGAKAFMKGLV